MRLNDSCGLPCFQADVTCAGVWSEQPYQASEAYKLSLKLSSSKWQVQRWSTKTTEPQHSVSQACFLCRFSFVQPLLASLLRGLDGVDRYNAIGLQMSSSQTSLCLIVGVHLLVDTHTQQDTAKPVWCVHNLLLIS